MVSLAQQEVQLAREKLAFTQEAGQAAIDQAQEALTATQEEVQNQLEILKIRQQQLNLTQSGEREQLEAQLRNDRFQDRLTVAQAQTKNNSPNKQPIFTQDGQEQLSPPLINIRERNEAFAQKQRSFKYTTSTPLKSLFDAGNILPELITKQLKEGNFLQIKPLLQPIDKPSLENLPTPTVSSPTQIKNQQLPLSEAIQPILPRLDKIIKLLEKVPVVGQGSNDSNDSKLLAQARTQALADVGAIFAGVNL